jgi:hypothetical protein
MQVVAAPEASSVSSAGLTENMDFFKGQKWIKMLSVWSYDAICMAAFAELW